MSDDFFEVAFSGQVVDAADLDNIKARVGKMFNADDAKIAQLFSGKRIVIKKNIDRATADKYGNAFSKAGAIAEVKSMAAAISPVADAEKLPEPAKQADNSDAETDNLTPPKTNPLGITGDQIDDLAATIAPVGSVMQDNIKAVDVPNYDLSGLDVAPVGSQLGASKKEADPPPPDTAGLSMAD